MSATEQKALPETFRDFLTSSIDESGAGLAHALLIHDDGTMTVMALDLEPDQIYRLMIAEWAKRPREMIFALDRFAKPGQGTTLPDLVAGWHFTRAQPAPFIVEYQHEPREVKAVDYGNAWWNATLTRELVQHMRASLGISTAGMPE